MTDPPVSPFEAASDTETVVEIEHIFAEIEHLNALMRADDLEIERLKREANEYREQAERWKAVSAQQRLEFQRLTHEGVTIAQSYHLTPQSNQGDALMLKQIADYAKQIIFTARTRKYPVAFTATSAAPGVKFS